MPVKDMASFIPTVHARVLSVLSAHDADTVKKEIFFSGQKAALERVKKAFPNTRVTSDVLKDPLGCFRVAWKTQFGAVRVFIMLGLKGWQVEVCGWDEESKQWIIYSEAEGLTIVNTKSATEAPQAQE